MEVSTTYTIRNDVLSEDAKLMREKGLSWFHDSEWQRERISNEKFKEIYKWITDKGNIVYTHVSMRSTQYKNVFINIDVYNEWKNSDKDFYFILSDKRKSVSPKYLHIKELKGKNLTHKVSTTEGVLIPEEWFHEFDKREKKC